MQDDKMCNEGSAMISRETLIMLDKNNPKAVAGGRFDFTRR